MAGCHISPAVQLSTSALAAAAVDVSFQLQPLLSTLTATVCVQRGMAALPDLHVSDSSEAMLSGRKPPFRLLVRAAHRDGRKINIRHAVSEGFVVSPKTLQCTCCIRTLMCGRCLLRL